MYYLTKTIEVAGAHRLHLDYDSKCRGLHGHNWRITVHCRGDKLDANGMLVDFTGIGKIVGRLDHADINEVIAPLNPTAENIAKWLCDQIPQCYKVEVQETEGNIATYER